MSPVGVRCAQLQSVFDVALNVESLTGSGATALRRLYAFTAGTARCRVGPELSQKYGVESDNAQLVVSITNKATLEQAWYNEVRTRKPQTFKSDAAALVDPTDGGRTCDFCKWRTLTAEDAWGRIERAHAVTASNLFKYGEPAHGLVLFKHHDPLSFSREQLADFLAVSADWFAVAAAAHPDARHPFFIWNCGSRAGASQFHGHGQLMLTTAPVPAQARLLQQAELHSVAHPGTSLYRDLVQAHAAVGLARVVGRGADRCWLVAHLAPQKDMEVLLLGGALTSPAFVAALHAALRAMVDGLGVQTFNCGVLNVPLVQQQLQRQQQCHEEAVVAGVAVDGPAGNGEAEAGTMAKAAAAAAALGGAGDSEDLWGLPPASEEWRPMMARVVSRGKVMSPASDFGCLEVIGHASIGHTDPFLLIRMIDEQLAAVERCEGRQ
ncbi:hypothetical protein VOLCADRAFT_93650 [Volvox carteri f. nagariensis]|uniref:Galactose-1-phosphate uridyl transferase N-terminal domain-containing protein n=1 Tax=Volvox carteri f. nagariensis TaxID=3068 RepID=D8U2N7_VOLCA|nr:uncharacterized protein VOLCADRAFT_93650 [Volvox carteri f. nagariensis]EFJ45930.1 hypothetical protein VOLCADRAFT_93650 [Volvox carteri f. nagariensis]|eukprot:XP_002953008.1 hypothetical protein VOLCADRAFT_93650 [Volvox carteri f. nagariensis]